MDKFINYGRQWIDEDDAAQVLDALRSDFLTQGPKVQEFEAALCEYTGARYCVALSNATAGLQLAVMALGLPEGMEGITSPNTFVASANALVYNRLKPVFADIDPGTYNIDPARIADKLSDKTGVIIPVHFAGRVCDMERIKTLTRNRNISIIEDAAHAIGSSYPNGEKVGCCTYSDMTVFSFHPVKTVTTAEGGAVTTNSSQLYEKLLLLRSHGITKDPELLKENPGPWYYEMQELGYNYRMTDLQAALGLSQMRKLDRFHERRNRIIEQYNEVFAPVTWITPPRKDNGNPCFHLYVVKIDFDRIRISRKEIMEQMRAASIGTQVHYIPVHTQPYYRQRFGYAWGDYPQAESYYNSALSLPLYPQMSDQDVARVISTVLEICE